MTAANKKVLQRQRTMALLIDAAIHIFAGQDFDSTGILAITSAANVAAGSLNNCFGNKECLGAYAASALLKHATDPARNALSFDVDPLLYTLTTITTYSDFMMDSYRRFFLDALRHDFFSNHLMRKPNPLTLRLIHRYRPTANPESITLYSEFMPYMLGRTLFLKKEEGFFTNIPYEKIPFLVCNEAMHYFVPEDELRRRIPESRRIAKEIRAALPLCPTMETIEATVRELSGDSPGATP